MDYFFPPSTVGLPPPRFGSQTEIASSNSCRGRHRGRHHPSPPPPLLNTRTPILSAAEKRNTLLMLVDSLQRELETRGSPSDRLPTLSVLHANAGTVDALSSCSDSPILYVHLVGLYRTFASNVENLLSFLTASHGSCWFIVLLTTSASDATDTWWSRSSNPPPRLDGDKISLSLQACATRLGGNYGSQHAGLTVRSKAARQAEI